MEQPYEITVCDSMGPHESIRPSKHGISNYLQKHFDQTAMECSKQKALRVICICFAASFLLNHDPANNIQPKLFNQALHEICSHHNKSLELHFQPAKKNTVTAV